MPKSIDGYHTDEEGKKTVKEVFTYGMIDIKNSMIDIKNSTSILVCIGTKEYEEEDLEKAFPVLLENIISFKILENCMRYTKK